MATTTQSDDKHMPNTFQCPNSYIDELGGLLDDGEFKTLMYLIRHIYGWQDKISSKRARLSLSKIASGFTTSGGTIYAGSGQSEQTVSRCLKSLAEFGIIAQTASNNMANDGAEWELLPSRNIRFDLLNAREDARKSNVRKRATNSIQSARDRRLNHSTSNEAVEPFNQPTLNRSTTSDRTIQPQVVEPFNTTNPIKPTSKPTNKPKIAANAAPLESSPQIQTPTEPEGEHTNGTSSPLQQSPIDDDISRAPAKTPDAPPVEPTATPRPRNVMFDKLAAMTHTTGAMAGPQIGKLIKQLKASHYDETHLANFELWWCQDWRSKDKQGNRGIVPTVGQIGQLFGVAMAWAEKHAPRPAPIVEQLSPEDAAALEARLMAEYEANEAEMLRRRIAAGYIKA